MLTRRQSHAIEIEDLTAKLASAQAEIGRLRAERDALAGKLGELLEAARLADASTWRELASIKEEMDRIRVFARTENAKELDHVCGERDAAIAKLTAASEEMKKITAAAHAEHALLETSRIENESLRCALKNATEESNRLQVGMRADFARPAHACFPAGCACEPRRGARGSADQRADH
jgi:septal ring factor EnvC (AmiA/AmiB activator)